MDPMPDPPQAPSATGRRHAMNQLPDVAGQRQAVNDFFFGLAEKHEHLDELQENDNDREGSAS